MTALASIGVAIALGVGCVPTPRPAPSSGLGDETHAAATALAAAGSAPAATAAPTPGPSRRAPGTLELDVGVLDPRWTASLLDFASDGESIIYSSGMEEGPDAEVAPDLWRYVPGSSEPELAWRNPDRQRSLVRVAGDLGTWAFVEIPVDGSRDWDLYVLPRGASAPVHLDSHPGDEAVTDLVPSVTVHNDRVVWTAFDRGRDGTVSQLLEAAAPDWQPRLLAERDAGVSELWFPSLRGWQLAYCEVTYVADRTRDERRVYVLDLADPGAEPRRLDGSGLATMPLMLDDGVIWKEADPGFSMFNWGRLFHHDLATGDTAPLPMSPQEYVNYPSAGSRFVTAWGADAFTFTIHDLELGRSRILERYDPTTHQNVLRPHIAGDLIVWLHSAVDDLGEGPPAALRYAMLPAQGESRGD